MLSKLQTGHFYVYQRLQFSVCIKSSYKRKRDVIAAEGQQCRMYFWRYFSDSCCIWGSVLQLKPCSRLRRRGREEGSAHLSEGRISLKPFQQISNKFGRQFGLRLETIDLILFDIAVILIWDFVMLSWSYERRGDFGLNFCFLFFVFLSISSLTFFCYIHTVPALGWPVSYFCNRFCEKLFTTLKVQQVPQVGWSQKVFWVAFCDTLNHVLEA